MTTLPGQSEQTVGNTFGVRTWMAYGFKHAKDELGWADDRVTDAAALERWWALVMSAYTLLSLQPPDVAARRWAGPGGRPHTTACSATAGRSARGSPCLGNRERLEAAPD